MGRYSFCLLIAVFFLTAQDRDYIVFPHQFHVEEMDLECAQCHEGVEESASLHLRYLPEEESCLVCHDGDLATDACSACHASPDNPMTYRERPKRPGPVFSHLFHVDRRPECGQCHAYIYADDGLALPTEWKQSDCRACHEQVRPDNHRVDWVGIHGFEVNSITQQNCMLCHTQVTCDDCHQLQQFEATVHPVSYLLNHGFDARSGITDCTVCHNIRSYCQDCHRQDLVMPMDHNIPDWVGLPGIVEDGGRHATAALDVPDVCLACHEPETQTCLRCHGQ